MICFNDIEYEFNIVIDPNQTPDQSECFPDLDNLPVYVCEDKFSPVNDLANLPDFSLDDFHIADNTCGNQCTVDECLAIKYCNEGFYVSLNNLNCYQDHFLGTNILDDISNLNLLIYVYSEAELDEFNIPTGSYLTTYHLFDSTCGGGVIDGFHSCDYVKGNTSICSSSCTEGEYSDGWTYEEIDSSTGDNGKLTITMEISATEIGEVVVEIDAGIQDILSQNIPSPEPIPLPGFNSFNIKGVKVSDISNNILNNLAVEFESSFIVPIDFNINMDNFFDDNGSKLTIPFIIDGNKIESISLASYLIAANAQESESFNSINLSYDFNIEPGDYTVIPENNQLNFGGISYSAQMSNLELAYISAIADSLDFAPSESTPIEGMPTGFEDFELFDLIMRIDLFNQIGIPVVLDFQIDGEKAGTSIDPVSISTTINSPSSTSVCSYEIGDTARTIIQINRNYQITNKFCGTDSTQLISSDTLIYSDENLSSFIDLLNFGPEQMQMNAGVWINGTGVLAPSTNIWGTFELIAPLAFIFNQDLTFMPEDNMTTLEAFDRSTAEQIDSSLVSAEINIEILNSSPIGGDLDLLISDSTFFPLYIDSLISTNTHYDSLLSVFNDSLDNKITYTEYSQWFENK